MTRPGTRVASVSPEDRGARKLGGHAAPRTVQQRPGRGRRSLPRARRAPRAERRALV